MSRRMDKIGNQAKDIFMTGAKTVAKVGEYPIHLVTSKEVIKYVEKPVSTIKTWMKFVAVMLAASLLLWQLIEKIKSYVDNPLIVTPEYKYEPNLPFPGIILCNSQPLRYSLMHQSALAKFLNDTVLNPGQENQSGSNWEEANALNLREFYLNYSQTPDEFIVGCKWPSNMGPCDASNFVKIITDYGPCYQLNVSSPPVTMNASGSVYSLQITINVDIFNSFPSSSSKTVGAFIALYYYDDPTPVVSHIGFNAPPGFETAIAMTAEEVIRSTKEKKGNCIEGLNLLWFKNYTTPGCYFENQLGNRINACECIPYNTPDYRHLNVSDEYSKNLSTILKGLKNCTATQQYNCTDKVESGTVATCYDACYMQRYSSELTYSLISPNQLKLSLTPDQRKRIATHIQQNIQNRPEYATMTETQYYKENFIILNIHFKELLRMKTVQHLQYEGLNFAGDIAGTIGIILGFLLSTLGDVIENCQMLYKKVRGVVDPGIERVIKIIEKEERIRPQDDEEAAGEGDQKAKTTVENLEPIAL